MDVNRCGGPETMTLIEQPRTLLMNNLLAASAANMNKSPPSSASDQQPILSAMHPMIVINSQDPQQQDEDDDEYIDEEEAQRRRESLARRPSYRRIVNDLYGAEMSIPSVCKLENIDADTSDDDDDDSTNNMNTAANLSAQAGGALAAATNLSSAVLPCISGSSFGDSLHYNASNILSLPGSLHLTCSATNGAEPNYTTSTIGLMSPGAAGNLVHYQSNSNQHQHQQHLHDCMPQSQHIVVPVNGDLLGLRPVTSNGGNQNLLFASGLPQVSGAGTVSSSNVHHQQHQSNQQSSQQQQQHHVRSTGNHDEAVRKREVRLLKNREAAKECRRKKKEYVKCLENRVAALEQQNKQLIEELKTLKDLYCQKGD